MEEYSRDLEKHLIKCGIQESEDQTIVRHLGGLDPRFANLIELQQYSNFDDVCVLTHQVKLQKDDQAL